MNKNVYYEYWIDKQKYFYVKPESVYYDVVGNFKFCKVLFSDVFRKVLVTG